MRVTQTMLFRDGLVGMQNRFQELQETQNQSLSGNRLNKPADDPAATFRQLIFETETRTVSGLITTTGLATKRLEVGERKIAAIQEQALKARDTILQISNDHMEDPTTMRAIAGELLAQFEDAMLNVNATLDGVTLFGGSRSVEPYDAAIPTTTAMKMRPLGEGVMQTTAVPALAVDAATLDSTHASYPGVPTSMRLTYNGATYDVMTDDVATLGVAGPPGGVIDLGWVQISVPAGAPPNAGDEFFFEVVPSYQGGVADRLIKTSEGQTANGNITGRELMEGQNGRNINIFGVFSGLRGALLRGDSQELGSWLEISNQSVEQLTDWQAYTGIRTVQVETAQYTLTQDKVILQESAALNSQADMFDVLSRLEQTTQAIQVMTMSQRQVFNTSLVDLLR